MTPISIWNTLADQLQRLHQTSARRPGSSSSINTSPFIFVQLNKRMLLSAMPTFFPTGAIGISQAQLDLFINNWLTADVGYFLAPIGFWSERLDPRWINKLPDVPLVMRQVIPDGLSLTGVQFRGGKYLFGSPVKIEYSVFATNGFGVPGAGKAANFADLGLLTSSSSGEPHQLHGVRRPDRPLAAVAGHQFRGLGAGQLAVRR